MYLSPPPFPLYLPPLLPSLSSPSLPSPGVAAAAAILSTRKRKRHIAFESNPALRKRYCSKLMRRLKETLDELSTRVGLQVMFILIVHYI